MSKEVSSIIENSVERNLWVKSVITDFVKLCFEVHDVSQCLVCIRKLFICFSYKSFSRITN